MNISDLEHLESISKESSVAGGIAIARAGSDSFVIGKLKSTIVAFTNAYAQAGVLIKFRPNLSPLVSTYHTSASASYIHASTK